MEAIKSNSNRKRPRENEDAPRRSQRLLAKRQRLPDEPQQFPDKSQPLDTLEFPTKITDLIDNCLKHIFGHLDQHSLFNMTVANGRLRPAAAAVYNRKFGTIKGYISNRDYHFGLFYPRDFKTCLQYIRCLGSLISDLRILYDDLNDEECEQIHHYVNEYCAESLVEIQFIYKPNRVSFDQFQKPFVNVHTVEVHQCDLGDQLPQFQQWFPNMQKLSVFRIDTLDEVEILFHNLKDIRIEIATDYITVFQSSYSLELCPQLQSVDIEVVDHPNVISVERFLNMIKDNRELRKLKIKIGTRWSVCWNEKMADFEQLAEQHPLLVELELLDRSKYRASSIISLVNQLNSLKLFRFEIDSRLEYDQLVAQLDSLWQPSYNHYTDVVTLKR